ncbi:MAG: hypothetical protein K2N54_09090, partial [Helicobacter sp.]|nr:hypothetical protein [Helicobacter sp.]
QSAAALRMRALFLGILPYSPSLAEGAGGGSLRASVTSVAINRQRIPTRWIASASPRNDKWLESCEVLSIEMFRISST